VIRRRSRRQAGGDAQAILETALVIPLMLLLISNFIGLMVQVSVQEQLDSAVSLAAASRFQASEEAHDPAGSQCCPDPRCCARAADATSLTTAGLPTGCRYAAETFYGTMPVERFLIWHDRPLCLTGGDSAAVSGPSHDGIPYARSPSNSHVSCDIGSTDADGTVHRGFLDHALNPPFGLYVVTCDATATLDFSRTPLAWGVFWSPALHAHAESVPPPFRQ